MVKKQVQISLNPSIHILTFHFLWGIRLQFFSLPLIFRSIQTHGEADRKKILDFKDVSLKVFQKSILFIINKEILESLEVRAIMFQLTFPTSEFSHSSIPARATVQQVDWSARLFVQQSSKLKFLVFRLSIHRKHPQYCGNNGLFSKLSSSGSDYHRLELGGGNQIPNSKD